MKFLKKILPPFLLVTSCLLFAQKKKIEYKPITGTTLEQSFPIAAHIIVENLKLGISEFQYGEKILKSTPFEYYRGILKYRGKWLFSINESGTMDVNIVEIEFWTPMSSTWTSSSEGLLIKKEKNLRAVFANDIRSNLLDQSTVTNAQNWFFTSLEINRNFFKYATDLAGDRWFEMYLKGKEIRWTLTFVDIENNNNSASEYKYKEVFTHKTKLTLASQAFYQNNFFITKYTNSDVNVLTQLNSQTQVNGFCRSLNYVNNKFYIVLTDELYDKIPVTTLGIQRKESSEQKSIYEVADKLKKLKELLDLGAITQDEYDKEKTKLLGN